MIERLDRFLATVEWCELFPNYSVLHLLIYRSDHNPIIITANHSYYDMEGAMPFKFESFWLSREDCREVVEKAWNTHAGADMVVKLIVVPKA